MSDKHPLDINVKYTSSSDCPIILLFDYEVSGGRKKLAYGVREHPKKEAFLKRGEIAPDLSGVKTTEEAQIFKKEFLSKYPQADNVYEHLMKFEKIYAEEGRRVSLLAAGDIVHYNNVRGIQDGLSEAERKQSFEFMKALLQAKSEGRNSDDVPMMKRPLLDSLGIKRNKLFHIMAETKERFEKIGVTKEQCGEILKSLPEKPFASIEEGFSFPKKASGYGDRSFDKKLKESFEAVAGDFIDIKIREDVSQLLDRKLRVHLQKLEKEKRLCQQKEGQQAKKEKALAENKAHGAEVQKKLRQKKAAQQRLHEKGLCSKPGEKSGKDVKWGDRKVSLETARGKGR